MNRVCLRCRAAAAARRPRGTTTTTTTTAAHAITRRSFADARRPSVAPKCIIDIKHIRQNADLYARTCVERNYPQQASHPARIVAAHYQWQQLQSQGRSLRERSNALQKILADADAAAQDRAGAQAEARQLKQQLSTIEKGEAAAVAEMQALALALPNLTSAETPVGDEPTVLSYINTAEDGGRHVSSSRRSHVDIGAELGVLDFAAAATSSGWGWYYLVGDAARLELALVSYALDVATRHGWTQVSPPSMVYSHIGSACGFQPRDAHPPPPSSSSAAEAQQQPGSQIYTIAQSPTDAARGVPQLCLAGTSEISLAAMYANTTLPHSPPSSPSSSSSSSSSASASASAQLPLKRVAVSRCYRAEAGARGSETRGLYRVHEFTKVELFAWTRPDPSATNDTFDEMLDMQTEILQSLDLPCRVLEMPSGDLGASAVRKVDMEAWFPGRGAEGSWGELTSASICTDYQTRRLNTRVRLHEASLAAGGGGGAGGGSGGKLGFPWTVNATALAVPRVIAALMENGWDEASRSVAIPEVLRPWMGGKDRMS
ncbi:Seryl-tRNA synthetase, class IIa [Moelleriella libera RCEF 2490]|uniref:serine--tRNA ligase n=1 Tax=Moelleriella libera RCEF 2490 TaxID=1081109 RepID=A0A168B8E6_9HYPO|nr:Seryl-tRNA synthetase, class IIa [Moelleriella libera RCEF 2490]